LTGTGAEPPDQVLTVSLDAAQIATGMPTSGRVGRHGEDE